jgi:hypothetical protein
MPELRFYYRGGIEYIRGIDELSNSSKLLLVKPLNNTNRLNI